MSQLDAGRTGAMEGTASRMSWMRVLKGLIALLIIAGFAAYLWEHRHELDRTVDASALHILALVALVFLTWFFNGLQAYVVYRAVGTRISLLEGIMLTVAGGFGNHLPMRAGTVVRALYLKHVKGLRFARFGGIMALRTLLTIVGSGIMGLFGLGLAWLGGNARVSPDMVSIFALLTSVALVLMLLPLASWDWGWRWLPRRLARIADDVADAYDALRRKPLVALIVVALIVTQYLMLGLRFLVSADAIQADVPFASVLLMAPLAALMSFTALTPGGLGMREAVMGYVSWSIGFDFAQGVFIGTIDRSILLLMTALWGGLSFAVLWRRIGRS